MAVGGYDNCLIESIQALAAGIKTCMSMAVVSYSSY